MLRTLFLCSLCLSTVHCSSSSKIPQEDEARTRVVEITQANFQNFMNLIKPVVIDVYSDRCVYCKRLEPIMHELALEMSDRYQFAKLSLDEEPALVESFNIKSFPTILFLNRGKEVGRHVGYMSKESFKKEIDSTFKPTAAQQ